MAILSPSRRARPFKNPTARCRRRGDIRRPQAIVCAAILLWAGLLILVAHHGPAHAQPAQAQEDVLTPGVRYDVLKHRLNLAIRAKNSKQTIGIIAQLRKTRLGVSGETLFYEAHAHYLLKNWTAAYRGLVAYLNTVGRKGRNYKAGIGLFVETEREIKKNRRMSSDLARADRSWTIASAAYDRVSKQRNAWKEKVKTFGGPKDDTAWAMARRADGGFLIGGTFEQSADKKKKQEAGRNMGLMALSRDGRMAWNRIVIGPAKDGSIRSLTALPKGGFLLGGVHRGFQIAARIDANAVPIRDHNGDPWVSGYARSKDGTGGVVTRAGNAGFIAMGAETFVKDGKNPRLPFAVRLSKDGKNLGKTVYTGNAARFWHDITDAVALPGGDIVAVGETRPQAAWDTRPGMGYMLRITPQGKVVWAQRIPAQGKGDLRFSAVAPAHGGGVIAAGRQGGRLFIFKAGADGREVWRKTIAYRDLMPAAARGLCSIGRVVSLVIESQKQKNRPPPSPDRVAAVRDLACRTGTPFVSAAAVSTRKYGYLVLAFQGRGNRKKTDIRLIAIDDSGKVLWDRIHGHDGFDLATSALATEDGGSIIAGTTDSIGTGGRDFLIFKIDRSGAFAPWTKLGPPAKPSPKPAKAKSPAPAADANSPEKPKSKSARKPEPAAKGGGGRATENSLEKQASEKQAPEKQAPEKQAPEKQAKLKEEPTEDGSAEAKPQSDSASPPSPAPSPKKKAKLEPAAEGGVGEAETPQEKQAPEKQAPEKQAKVKEEPTEDGSAEAKPQPDSASPAEAAGEDPPETSFGEIFGAVFGGGDSEKPDTPEE